MTAHIMGQAVLSPQPPPQATTPPLQPGAGDGQGYPAEGAAANAAPPLLNTLALMKGARIWLVWKSIQRPGKEKPDKVPFYVNGTPRSGTLDAPDDRAGLTSYLEAVAAMEAKPGVYAGLAIALGPDGTGFYWQGVDLDEISQRGLKDVADLWTRVLAPVLGMWR